MPRSALKLNVTRPLPVPAPARSLTIDLGANVVRSFSNAEDALDYAQHEFDEATDSLNAMLKAKAAWLDVEKTWALERVLRLAEVNNDASLDLRVAEEAAEALRPAAWRLPLPGQILLEYRSRAVQEANWQAADQTRMWHARELHRARLALEDATDFLNSSTTAANELFDADINVCLERSLDAASKVNAAEDAFLMDYFASLPTFDADTHGTLPVIPQPAGVQGLLDMTDSDDGRPVHVLSPIPEGDELAAQQANDRGVVAMMDCDRTGLPQDGEPELQLALTGISPNSANHSYH